MSSLFLRSSFKPLRNVRFSTTKATQSAQYLRYETEYGVNQYLAMHYGQNINDTANFTIVPHPDMPEYALQWF